jgi:hypothetical protein
MSDNTAEVNGYRVPLPRIKRPDYGVNHLLPSSADVTNEKSYSSASLINLHGEDRKNCTFTLLTYSIR